MLINLRSYSRKRSNQWLVRLTGGCLAIAHSLSLSQVAWSQSPDAPASDAPASEAPPLRVVVNSNQDGPIQPDAEITLREAIAITNGTLPLDQLSQAEAAQVSAITQTGEVIDPNSSRSLNSSRIEFNLPPDQTTIELVEVLPDLARPNLIVDGTTQPGYDASGSATAEIEIPVPIVALTPAVDREVFRGLTIVADNVTVRGLSLYGFTARLGRTATTPPADIFIAHPFPPPDTSRQQPPAATFPFDQQDVPPQGVVIENNWLGILPDESIPSITSAFGVSVFNSRGTTVRRNRIQNHDGSAIITSVRAENLQVTENILVGNGIAGMPDAIRLEGIVSNSQIASNLICGNDGSGIFFFRTEGPVQVTDNDIRFNGRRFRRAAVYLMGDDHRVLNNQISYQAGPGVVVTGYTQNNILGADTISQRNLIQGNQFAGLEGLSIDLNTQQNVRVQDFQRGDGPNPHRNSPNDRRQTGNAAINSPRFVSSEFFVVGNKVNVGGVADPGSDVEVYRVVENVDPYGPLNEPLATVSTDAEGRFSLDIDNLQPGDRVSAIASDSRYGTSEPAPAALVRSPSGSPVSPSPTILPTTPVCVTPPVVQLPPEPEPEPEPEPIQVLVPRNIHFALDQATISPTSAAILDQIAAFLLEYPSIVVDLEGHTDPRASDNYNLELGNRRALAARNYLIRAGIAPERMTIRSFGERQRRTTGNTRLDFARDRRVEFTFSDTRGAELILQEEDLQLEPPGGRR